MYRQYIRVIMVSTVLVCALLMTTAASSHAFAATGHTTMTRSFRPNHACPMTVQEGSQGEAVVTLQGELNWIFGYDVPVTGYFGPETDAAVRDFQTRAGLPANGIVDPTTWHALGEC